MALSLSDLRALLSVANVAAFLRVIRERESSQDESAYTILNGGSHFVTGWGGHPFAGQRTPPAKAAGAYQFIASTWAEVSALYGITDFSPRNQDLGAIGRIIYRQALDDVIAGRFESAVIKCRKEWTSLPGAAESSSGWTMDKARAVYLKYGGGVAVAPKTAPIDEPRKRMDPLSIFGPIIAQLIPQLAKVINNSGNPLAQVALDTIVKATGATNEQEAVAKMQSDPAMLQAATEAVVTHPDIMGIVEIGGGIKAAREADVAATQADRPFWYSQAFWVSSILLVMPFMLLVDVFYVHPSTYDGSLRTQIVTGVLAIILVVCGYYLGSSQGSQKKDELIAKKGSA